MIANRTYALLSFVAVDTRDKHESHSARADQVGDENILRSPPAS